MSPRSKKEYVEAIFLRYKKASRKESGTKKPLVRKDPSSLTNSVRLVDTTESMRSDYSEDLDAS